MPDPQELSVRAPAHTCPFAPGLLGFEEWTGHVVTGEHMGGVHFENAEAARKSTRRSAGRTVYHAGSTGWAFV